MYSLPVTSRTIGGVLEDIFKLYVAVMPKCWPISLLAAVVSAVPFSFARVQDSLMQLQEAMTQDTIALLQGEFPTATSAVVAGVIRDPVWELIWTVEAVLFVFCFIALLVRMNPLVSGRDGTAIKAMKVALRLVPRSLLASAAYGVATLIGFALFIAPGVIWTVSLMFFSVLIVFDGAGAVDSLLRSHRLVKGGWWRAGTVSTLATLASVPVAMIIGRIVEYFAALMKGNTVLAVALNVAVDTLFLLPFYASILVGLYYDLRLRKYPAERVVTVISR